MARYAFDFDDAAGADNTTSAVIHATTGALSRAWIDEFIIGSDDTPADNPFQTQLQRTSTAGTNTAVTPALCDSADVAARSTCGENHSAEPTYTASTVCLRVDWNQRTTFRWSAAPGRELVIPATANNGFGVRQVEAAAVAIGGTIGFRE